MSTEKSRPSWRDLVKIAVINGAQYAYFNCTRAWVDTFVGEGWTIWRHDNGMYQMIMRYPLYLKNYPQKKTPPAGPETNEWGEVAP